MLRGASKLSRLHLNPPPTDSCETRLVGAIQCTLTN
jgi:hypothetical protein